jgi:hypothetical protein
VPAHVRSANSPLSGSYSKIDRRRPDSSTAGVTIVVKTSSASSSS